VTLQKGEKAARAALLPRGARGIARRPRGGIARRPRANLLTFVRYKPPEEPQLHEYSESVDI